MSQFIFSVDPECPVVEAFHRKLEHQLVDALTPDERDALSVGVVEFDRLHLASSCARCVSFARENVIDVGAGDHIDEEAAREIVECLLEIDAPTDAPDPGGEAGAA